MATKKKTVKKPATEEGTMNKIAGKIGELAGRLMNKKDEVTAMASSAIDNAKSAIQNVVAVKKAVPEKAGRKANATVSKKAKAVVKKAASVKKSVKKAAKKAAPKPVTKKKK